MRSRLPFGLKVWVSISVRLCMYDGVPVPLCVCACVRACVRTYVRACVWYVGEC